MDYIELKKTEIYFPSELWSEIKYFALGKRWNLNNHINDEIHSYRSELKYLKQINKKEHIHRFPLDFEILQYSEQKTFLEFHRDYNIKMYRFYLCLKFGNYNKATTILTYDGTYWPPDSAYLYETFTDCIHNITNSIDDLNFQAGNEVYASRIKGFVNMKKEFEKKIDTLKDILEAKKYGFVWMC